MNNLQSRSTSSGRNQAYLIGAAAGVLFGLLSAYLYNRAASDSGTPANGQNRIQTGEVLGLGLALLGVVRQITEMGRGPEPKRGRRK